MAVRRSRSHPLTGCTNRRRFVGASALAAASIGALRVPLVGAQGTEVTCSSWGNTGEVANLKDFNDSFNASQSEVTAKYIPVPTDGYDDKLLTQLNGGTAPDLFYVGDGQIATLIKNEVVALIPRSGSPVTRASRSPKTSPATSGDPRRLTTASISACRLTATRW